MEGRMNTLVNLAVLLLIWLATGFTLGTLTLLGPVRWTTTLLRARGVAEIGETMVVLTLILLLVIVSFGLSYFLMRRTVTATRWWKGAAYPAMATAAALLTVWIWLTPGLINSGSQAEELAGTRFTFGPYPTRGDLRRLKNEGFTDVISLLHPAVVPFEPRLLSRELEAGKAAGINVIHTPMLPWLSDNNASIEKLRALILEGEGKYYVHCYLGRDRVGVVRRLVSQLIPDAGGTLAASGSLLEHPIAAEDDFERGVIVRLDEGVYLTPYPTDEEFLAFVFQEATGTVVSMLDPDVPSELRWLEKEREALARYAVPFLSVPVPSDPFEPERVMELVARVKGLGGNVIVHGLRDDSPSFEAFAQAYRFERAPLPPAIFDEPLEGGNAEVVAPGVAIGPAPSQSELIDVLHRRGIRGIVYVGNGRPDLDPQTLDQSGLELRAVRPDDHVALVNALGAPGPWYVFGASLESTRRAVAALGLESLGQPPSAAQPVQ